MYLTKSISLASSVLILAAAPLIAQETKAPAAHESHRAGLREPVFVEASIGPQAFVDDPDGHRVGVVRDHLLDGRSGRVLFVAVTPAKETGTARLVPFSRFVWNAEEKRLQLPMSAEELTSLSEYRPEERGGRGLGSGVDTTSDNGDPREAAMPRTDGNLSSSTVLGCRVIASKDPFASVDALVLDPERGTIAFVLATGGASKGASKGDPYVVPWTAMNWQESEETAEASGHFAVSIAPDRMAEAPRLKGGAISLLGEKKTLEAIYEFYRVSSPIPLDGTRG